MSLNSDGGAVMTMPVQPANNYGGFGFGGDGAWWIIILFLFVFCGWGGNWGNGGFGGNSSGAVDGYILTSDFANIERKIDGVNNGLCDGFYNQAQLTNSLQQNMNNGFMSAELSRANQQAALMQMLFQMQIDQQKCCCDNREAIQGVNYNIATQSCENRTTVHNVGRDIIDSMNAGFRGIEQRLTAQEIAQKDAKIAEQNQQLFAAQLAASQAAQTGDIRNYVSAQLAYYNPRPVPSFDVPAPYQFSGCNAQNGCNGC